MPNTNPEAWRMFRAGGGFWKTSKILSNYYGKMKDSDLVAPFWLTCLLQQKSI